MTSSGVAAVDQRRLRHLAWLPLTLTTVIWVWFLATVPMPEEQSSTELWSSLAAVASVLGFSIVGFYLSYRLPGNAVGWVLAGYGLFFTLNIAVEDAITALSGPATEWLAWVSSWSWVISGSMLAIFLPLLFPDGRLPSRRWRWLPRLAVLAMVAIIVANALSVESMAPIRNPMGRPELTEQLDLLGLVGFVLFAACIVAAAISVVGRFRRSRGIARRQMLVFAASAVVVAGGIGASYTLYELDQPDAANLAVGFVSLAVPAAVGMAVLRYRLYDLGRLVKRTATYTAVALVLFGVYWTAILALQSVLGADDSLSVAASTLLAAAVFSPAKKRIQTFIDRRFDRARYDASKVVDEFSSRLSQEVNLNDLNGELTKVVGTTLRPAAISVWVRSA